ncbi:DUF4031 domain-containing protein [Frigoribacterium salinisoli]
MSILIDDPVWPAHGTLWAHLVSDETYDELHDFAGRHGVPRRAFDHDHYDVPEARWADLVAAGAVPVTGLDLARRLERSGLRVSQRRKRGLGDAAVAPRP